MGHAKAEHVGDCLWKEGMREMASSMGHAKAECAGLYFADNHTWLNLTEQASRTWAQGIRWDNTPGI